MNPSPRPLCLRPPGPALVPVLLLTSALVGAAPAALAQAKAAPAPLRIGGSSTVFPIVQRAISLLPPAGGNGAPRFVLEENGTAAGFRDFCAGRLVIANASRPINAAELEACRRRGVTFSELPLAFDAISVVVPRGNTWLKSLSLPQLRTLWSRAAQGRVSRWNQVDPAWPNRPIRLCGPGKDSGTFDYSTRR